MNAERAYTLLLGLYPRAFRKTFGFEMRQTFRAAHQRAALERRLLTFWVRIVLDAVFSAALEHARARGANAMTTMIRVGAVCFMLLGANYVSRQIWWVFGDIRALLFWNQLTPFENAIFAIGLFGLWLTFNISGIRRTERILLFAAIGLSILRMIQEICSVVIFNTGYQLSNLPPTLDRFPWWFNLILTVYPIFSNTDAIRGWLGSFILLLLFIPRMIVAGRFNWTLSPLENRIGSAMMVWVILILINSNFSPAPQVNMYQLPPRWDLLPSLLLSIPNNVALIVLGVVLWRRTITLASKPLASN